MEDLEYINILKDGLKRKVKIDEGESKQEYLLENEQESEDNETVD